MDKQYEIIKATRRDFDVEVNGKKMPFGKGFGAFRVKDKGVADAIRQKYGGDVTVTEIPAESRMAKKLHPNRIISPGMPWHKYDEYGRIIREDKHALQDRKGDRKEKQHIQSPRN